MHMNWRQSCLHIWIFMTVYAYAAEEYGNDESEVILGGKDF